MGGVCSGGEEASSAEGSKQRQKLQPSLTPPLFLGDDIDLGILSPRNDDKVNSAHISPLRRGVSAYFLGKTLGQGTYAKVKLASMAGSSDQKAVKIIDRAKLANEPAGCAQVAAEINAMKILRHQNVIRLHEVIDTPATIFLIMEFAMYGDMLTYINGRPRLHELHAFTLFKGLVEGLHFCHTLGVCHRDLKLENLLLSGDNDVKIADFGMASILQPLQQCHTLCGSPDYAAPEMLCASTACYDGVAADVWSAGVILFAFLCRMLPFQTHEGTMATRFECIVKAKFAIPRHVSSPASRLIRQIFMVDPSVRPSLPAILQTEWMQAGAEEIRRQRTKDYPPVPTSTPARRPTSTDCLESGGEGMIPRSSTPSIR